MTPARAGASTSAHARPEPQLAVDDFAGGHQQAVVKLT
jgi:hypothetical protein